MAQTGWSSRVIFTKLFPDFFENPFEIPIQSLIFEPNYFDPSLLQIPRSPVIILTSPRPKMPCPIQFHNNAIFRTKKVDNVRTNATLSAKFLSIELAVF